MKIHLTFDVEIWCNGWGRLDEVFPAQFERYVYGRSRHGEFALPAELEILRRHGLTAVFFVEPLFSARFGDKYLEDLVGLIRADDQEVQLHIHPEWIDEIEPAIVPNNIIKRQHLCHYDLEEQTAIICYGKKLLQNAGGGDITTFRAGSYAANRATFEALRRNKIFIDSSVNACFDISGADLRVEHSLLVPFRMADVSSYPITVFRDGFGRLRPAQIGACSFEEMRDAISRAMDLGCPDFVVVAHNFELLKTGSSDPDLTVVRRFEKLCDYLAVNSNVLDVCGFGASSVPKTATPTSPLSHPLPNAKAVSTARRYVEQFWRHFG